MSLPHNIGKQLEFISACIAYFSFIAERINAWQLIRVEYSAIRTCLSLLGLSLLSFRLPKCVTSARRKSGFRGQKFSFRGGTSASDRAFLIATKVRSVRPTERRRYAEELTCKYLDVEPSSAYAFVVQVAGGRQ